ncbi:MAG: cadmium-translocating P-type ATPase [Chloroflexi bacterium]|nr:cadmium-translocating P-type ATPase [Chloroflexota bacterium]
MSHHTEHHEHRPSPEHRHHETPAPAEGAAGAGEHAGHDPENGGYQRHAGHRVSDFRRRFWVSLVITVPILALSPLIQEFLNFSLTFPGDAYVLWGLSSAIFFYGGYPFLKGILGELTARRPGMMTLIALAITVAYAYSSAVTFGLRGEVFFWELATLIDVMLLGHWLEMRSIMGASTALEGLARLMPAAAHRVMPDGAIKDVPLGELALADRVLVRPGEKVPADGKVTDGETSVDESMLTGESNQVFKKAGDAVIGGSINGEGAVTVEVQRTGQDSYLAQMTELVRQAQASKSRTQALADKAALGLTIIAISAGGLTVFLWLAVLNQDFAFALERMVTVMVISCPHALGLAIPLVVAVSTSLSARNGLLIKDRDGFEKARGIQAMIFDKTGTLTLGKFGVTDVVSLNGMPDEALLKLAASVEGHSQHPIARGVVAASPDLFPIESFLSVPGKGAQARVNGREVKVVSPGYLRENGLAADNPEAARLTAEGKTVVYVVIDGQAAGAIALADIIRPESREAIARLKQMGIRCLMVTGDNRQVAAWVARETGLDEYFAEVLPDKKAEKVKEVQARGLKVAMTGDGVNDAPALAQADVGIAIGAGTEVAIATADIILVRSNPLDVVTVVNLARTTYRKMLQNLAWATGYNVVAIPLAAGVLYGFGVLLSPALGAALMSLSTIIVAINSRFIRLAKPGQAPK